MSKTHPLRAYLDASRETVASFADRLGLDRGALDSILNTNKNLTISIARRIAVATGGAITLEDLFLSSNDSIEQGDIIDLCEKRADGEESLNIDRLSETLAETLLLALGGDRDKITSETVLLATEAVAHTYDALAKVTTRHGPDRLQQALLPVLEAILLENLGLLPDQADLPKAATAGALLYYRL